MFDNIGSKIMKLAKVLCWIGIILSIIYGIIIMAAGNRSYNGGGGVLAGLLVIVIGCLASWVGSFFAYGFGQLIEDTQEIRRKMP